MSGPPRSFLSPSLQTGLSFRYKAIMAHDSQSIAQKGEEQHRITIAFLVLAWVFILLRTFTRTFIISNFGWDDLTMVLAGMIFTIYCSGLFYLASNGGGTHVTSVVQMQLLIKWTIASEASYLATIMVLKISLGIFFARIVAKTWQLRLIYITVAINVVSSLAAFFFVLLRCGPNLDAYITRQLAGLCTPMPLDQFFAYQQAAFTTLTDFVFATLPILILWNASMDRRSKISVGFILSLAALGCICSMIRFRYIEGLIQYSDFFWNAVNISLWSCIEPGAGIIAACLATLRPLLKRAFTTARSIRSLRSTASNTTTASPGGSADRKTVVSAGGTVTASSTWADSKAGPVLWKEYYGMEEQMFDLRSENGTTRDSTENMLAHHRNIDVEQSHCCAQVQRGTANSQSMSEGHLPHGSRGRSEKQDVWPHTITI